MNATKQLRLHFAPSPLVEQCMYSGVPLDGSHEHILPEAIGATLKSDKLISSTINTLSSGTLDPAIFQPLEIPCYFLGIPGKSGARRIRLPMADGRTVEFGTDFRPTILEKPKPTIIRTPQSLTIKLEGSSYEQLSKVARSAAGEYRDRLEEREKSIRYTPLEPLKLSLHLDIRLWSNALRKSALSLIGYFDSKLARSVSLRDARRAVFDAITGQATQDDAGTPVPSLLDGNVVLGELGADALGPVDHVLAVSCDPTSQRATAFLRLFGKIDNSLLLSTTYDGPRQTLVYCRNPIAHNSAGTKTYQMDRSCSAISTYSPMSAENWGHALHLAFQDIMHIATIRAQELALAGLPDCALPDLFVPTGTPVDSPSNFAASASVFVRDFISVVDIQGCIDETTREELIAQLAVGISAFYPEFSTRMATPALKHEVGLRWLEWLSKQFYRLSTPT